jgi:hypothetical protein
MTNPEVSSELPFDSVPQYVLRFEPGGPPQPPIWIESEIDQAVAIDDNTYVNRTRMFSALVRAALDDRINPEALAEGLRPVAKTVWGYAGRMMVMSFGVRRFEELLEQMPMRMFTEAVQCASEIEVSDRLPYPARRRQPTTDNSYNRLLELHAQSAEKANIIREPYISWQDVCEYYQEPLSQTVGPADTSQSRYQLWGTFQVKDLADYPYPEHTPLHKDERMLLQHRFVDLDGVPYLDQRDDLDAIIAALPAGTPVLCFLENTRLLALRSGEKVNAEPLQLSKEEVLFMNMVILRSLRTCGRSVGYAWLQEKTGYSNKKNATHGRPTAEIGWSV